MHHSVRLGATLLVLATAGLASLAGTPSASADPEGPAVPSENRSVALVTRLTLAGGHGWLTVQVRLASSDWPGFEIAIPSGEGSWTGADDVRVPGLGVHCRRDAGADLHYRCGRTRFTDPASPVQPGRYQVSIPVSRTGEATGLTGSAWVDVPLPIGTYRGLQTDTFPVRAATDPQSTAEVGSAALLVDPQSLEGDSDATVSLTVTVAPGESVTALDITLPPAGWAVTGGNAAAHGVSCTLATSGPSLRCRSADASRLPEGRYLLVSRLRVHDASRTGVPDTASSTITMTTADGPTALADTFAWLRPVTL